MYKHFVQGLHDQGLSSGEIKEELRLQEIDLEGRVEEQGTQCPILIEEMKKQAIECFYKDT